jgi:RsiW-degrading membrane proteinase PrsW (M82 family)
VARLLLPLLIGVGALVAGTALGVAGAGQGMGSWPLSVRAALVGVSVAIGLALLARAVAMMAESRPDGLPENAATRDVGTMIRGVRLAFLAVAAFAAAGAFLVGHPLLLVVALIIAGVDVVETSFLLLVARTHRGDDRSG